MSYITKPPFEIADLAGEDVTMGGLSLTNQPELILIGNNGTRGSYGTTPELVNPMQSGVMAVDTNVGGFAVATGATTGYVKIPEDGYYLISYQVFTEKASGTIGSSDIQYNYLDIDTSPDATTWTQVARATNLTAGRTDFIFQQTGPTVLLELSEDEYVRFQFTVNIATGSGGWAFNFKNDSAANSRKTNIRIWKVA